MASFIQSRMHLNSSLNHESCNYITSNSTLIKFNKNNHLGTQKTTSCKWLNVISFGSSHFGGVKVKENNNTLKKKIGSNTIRCTAEGVERGRFRGGEEGRFVVAERLKVVALLGGVMCLCNADRVVMSVAIVPLAAKHGWNSSFLGIVQSSFLWGYILSSTVGGALVDKYGGKKVIAWGAGLVLAPVSFDVIHWHLWSFILRLSASLVVIFIVSGSQNDPRDSKYVERSELRLIQAGKSDAKVKKGKLPSLQLLFSKLPTWAIIFANMMNNWGYFVLLTWMPVYFKTVFNVNLKQAAWFSAVPWGTMAISGYIAGVISDFLIKSGYTLTVVRKMMQSIGFIGPGVSLLCLNYAKTPEMASVYITLALSLSSFSQAGFFLNMQDIAPECAGFLHGISNSAGTFAAILSTVGTGFFVQWLGSFQAFLVLTACLYFAAAIFWNLFATAERVF
ncbi:hypothetical protein Leryth_004169 [Lithospermum erythrorhizon]|nr:hypothetical protein Leryth_004169 [Lithospermum erythrorhizon]